MSTVRANAWETATGTQSVSSKAFAKSYCRAGSAGNIAGSYNISSVDDNGTGDIDFNYTNNMTDSTSHVSQVTTEKSTSGLRLADVEAQLASDAHCLCYDTAFAAADPTAWQYSNHGDLA